jgi:hypothetical protein
VDITIRNFFRLLRAGIFDTEEQIEPMSAWKWRRVYQYSLMHDVAALTFDGINKCNDQFFMQLPDDLLDTWKETTAKIERENQKRGAVMVDVYGRLSKLQSRPILMKGQRLSMLYGQPSHRYSKNIEIFFPYETQGEKADKWATENCDAAYGEDGSKFVYSKGEQCIEHYRQLHTLTNKVLNHRLQTIIEREFRESEPSYIEIEGERIEVASNTLEVLLILLRVARHVLNNGILLKHIADLGVFLRVSGDKIDFVKLQGWIARLHMKRIALLAGMLLIKIFNFTIDEIPFVMPGSELGIQRIMNELFLLKNEHSQDWYFQQGKDIFVHASNSSAMMWHVRQSAQHFSYYPSESITNFFASIAHSLSHIEE